MENWEKEKVLESESEISEKKKEREAKKRQVYNLLQDL